MKKLLEQEWAPLPDGLLVMGVDIFAGEVEFPVTRSFVDLVSRYMDQCDDENSFDLRFLSSVKPPLGWFCAIHGHINGKVVTSLQLKLSRKPREAPPKFLSNMSRKLQGFSVGLPKFFRAFKAERAECKVGIHGFLLPEQKAFSFDFEQPEPAKGLKFQEAALRFEVPKSNSKVEVILPSGDYTPKFKVSGHLPVVLNSKCFEVVADALSENLNPIFEKNGAVE